MIYQAGIKGLSKAIERFDLEMDFRFSTYAGHWIKNRMRRYIKNKVGTIREPIYIQELTRELCSYASKRGKKVQELDFDRASEDLEIDKDKLRRAARSMGVNANSMDEMEDGPGSYSPSGSFEDPSELVAQNELDECLFSCLDRLDDRQRKIIKGRYFEDRTLKEIGEDLDLTKERIRQIEEASLEELREMLEDKD